VARRLEELCERAIDHGCAEHARLGFHMLAHLRWEGGAWSEAQRDALRAEMVSRSAEPGEHVVALAEAARCLALLERDLGQAESLLLEASALAQRTGIESEAIAAADGILRLHQGDLEAAAALLGEARRQARNKGDRYGEFQALEHLAIAAMQRGAISEAARLTDELALLGDRLRDGSEAPFARALAALLRDAADRDTAADGSGADGSLDEALDALRAADSKYRLAFILTRASLADIASGNPARARRRAAEALACARSLERPSEIALARVALVRAAFMLGDEESARREMARNPHAAGTGRRHPFRRSAPCGRGGARRTWPCRQYRAREDATAWNESSSKSGTGSRSPMTSTPGSSGMTGNGVSSDTGPSTTRPICRRMDGARCASLMPPTPRRCAW
jgi:hypothetical protein